MPLYRVTWDGQDILDYTRERMVLLSPHLVMEVNTAGSLTFTVPPYHTFYDLFTDQTMLISDVEVYEDDELIWFGRPIELKTDFFKQKEIYCEGALAFFNDSIHEKNKYDNVWLRDFFERVVSNHNYQVDAPRQFLIGKVDIDNRIVYREPNYEKTIDVLRGQCLDTNDGYFFVRRFGGKNYIDWVKDMPYTCNQTIEFAENMLNVTTQFDGSDFATCVFPLGASDDNGDPINVRDVNGGDPLIISDMAQIYGRIVTVVNFSDIDDKSELLYEGRKALERILYNSRIIECSAADLHSKDGSKEIFRVGQMVHCLSQPHGLEMDLPLSKMELSLDTAAKNITLGIIKKKTLTRITKNKATETPSQDYDPTPSSPSTITDPDGDEWELNLPENDGGPVTANRMPIKITITRDPNKTTYNPGEALDFTGLIVNIWTKDKNGNDSIWTKPPTYVDGVAPMSELSFSTRTAPNIETFSVMVTWKYKGKSYNTTLGLRTSAEVEPTGISDLRNWTKHAMPKLTVGSNTISGQMTLGDYERLSYKINTGKNRNGVFSLSFSGTVVDGDTGSQVGHHTFIAVCTSIFSGYIENAGNKVINKIQVSGSGTYNVPFNSGENDSVYLVIDLAAVKDGDTIDFHYTNIRCDLQ